VEGEGGAPSNLGFPEGGGGGAPSNLGFPYMVVPTA